MTIKKTKTIILILSGLVLVGLGVVTGIYFSLKSNAIEQQGHIYIRENTSYEGLLDSLSQGDAEVKNLERFDRIARSMKLDQGIRPGHYHLKKGMSYLQLVRTFQRGWQTPVRVTFNHIRTIPQLAGRIGGQIESDSMELLKVMRIDTMPRNYGFTKEEFIGMFIPNTYEMYWTVTPQGFLDRMKREYDNFWTEERDSKRQRTGLSRNEVITLASIVYEETFKSDEMPRVAGVYVNRLKQGMLLQADPTVKFAVGDFTLRRILFAHLEVDSPYNTYKHSGLPPGPICIPSIKAIDSVLDYESHSYIYFCAKEDFSGYHNFARTLTEHNRNAQHYQAALNRNGIR